MKIFRISSFFAAILFLSFATSCVESVVVGSITTAAVATRDKSLNNTRYDLQIYSTLESDFLQNGLKNFGNSVDITVNEGRVLLTGIVRDAAKAKMASEIAWKALYVKEVIDEIQVREGESVHFKDVLSSVNDYLITGRVEFKLFITKKIPTFNYKTTTVDKTLYLIGTAHSDAELDKVLVMLSKVRGVDKIVSHVILANDKRRKG